ncbi:F-box and associated interaction domains-containing protein [Striga asiatica]|uniref:F-box and associated interaction domains-containing protein n=1 Tax=Striga asiatica TaxID=4170 RepID=A0A5A7PXS7_STRAF|nr:F-box and associated interaction domains-containing protein [Striga asiatica]
MGIAVGKPLTPHDSFLPMKYVIHAEHEQRVRVDVYTFGLKGQESYRHFQSDPASRHSHYRVQHLDTPNPVEAPLHQDNERELQPRRCKRINAPDAVDHHLHLRLQSGDLLNLGQHLVALHLFQENVAEIEDDELLDANLHFLHQTRFLLGICLDILWRPWLRFRRKGKNYTLVWKGSFKNHREFVTGKRKKK